MLFRYFSLVRSCCKKISILQKCSLKYKHFASIHLPSLICWLLCTNTLNAIGSFVTFKALLWVSLVNTEFILEVCTLYKIITIQYSYYKIVHYIYIYIYIYEYYWLNKLLPCWKYYCQVYIQFLYSVHTILQSCTCVGLLSLLVIQGIWVHSQCFHQSRMVKGRSWRKRKLTRILKTQVRQCSLDPVVLHWNATVFDLKRRLHRIY